jgi:hypothetical protein
MRLMRFTGQSTINAAGEDVGTHRRRPTLANSVACPAFNASAASMVLALEQLGRLRSRTVGSAKPSAMEKRMIDVSGYHIRETPSAAYFWGGPPSQWYLKAPFRQRIVRDGAVYRFNCAEQYMMAVKAQIFRDQQAFDAIMEEKQPKKQKALGREVRSFDLATWTQAVPDILVRGNLAKFSQHPDILEWLLSTASKRLVEGSPTDRIYGVGIRYDDPRIEDPANWDGLNLLGIALETVRERLSQLGTAQSIL